MTGVISVGKPRLWCRLRADQDVHDSNEFCEGLGSGVPSPGCDEHAVLDRDTSQRPAAVARQSPVSDGLTSRPDLFRVIAADSAVRRDVAP